MLIGRQTCLLVLAKIMTINSLHITQTSCGVPMRNSNQRMLSVVCLCECVCVICIVCVSVG